MTTFRQQEVSTPHFALPFRFGGINGGALLNEQESDEDLEDCVRAILAFPVGSRDDLPTFGSPDIVFKEPTEPIAGRLASVIARWEPRTRIGAQEIQQTVEIMRRTLRLSIGGRSDA